LSPPPPDAPQAQAKPLKHPEARVRLTQTSVCQPAHYCKETQTLQQVWASGIAIVDFPSRTLTRPGFCLRLEWDDEFNHQMALSESELSVGDFPDVATAALAQLRSVNGLAAAATAVATSDGDVATATPPTPAPTPTTSTVALSDQQRHCRELSESERQQILLSDNFQAFFARASRVVERALAETETEYFETDGEADAGSDAYDEGAVAGVPACAWSRGRCVTALDWSPHYQELCLAAYAESQQSHPGGDSDGVVCVWNARYRCDSPEFALHCQSPVTSACFATYQRCLIVGGTYSGQLVLWDTRTHRRTPVQRSTLGAQGHTEPDARLCTWSLESLTQPVETCDLMLSAAGHSIRSLAATCLDMLDGNRFVAGTEDAMLRASAAGTASRAAGHDLTGRQPPESNIQAPESNIRVQNRIFSSRTIFQLQIESLQFANQIEYQLQNRNSGFRIEIKLQNRILSLSRYYLRPVLPYLGMRHETAALYTRVSFDRELNSQASPAAVTAHDARKPRAVRCHRSSNRHQRSERLFARFPGHSIRKFYIFKVPENSQFGSLIGQLVAKDKRRRRQWSASTSGQAAELAMISADDADFGDNGRLVYSLLGAADTNSRCRFCDVSLFHLNPQQRLAGASPIATIRFADSRVWQTDVRGRGRRRWLRLDGAGQQSLTVHWTAAQEGEGGEGVSDGQPAGDAGRNRATGRRRQRTAALNDLVVVTVCVGLSFLVLLCVVLAAGVLLATTCRAAGPGGGREFGRTGRPVASEGPDVRPGTDWREGGRNGG
uniref:WD_REPEATS_REGION domain-containing protein n=1 Tax=Macrostomum lignano TaxID=282301 RepID=A0A1I8JNY0_9PLAT